MNALVHDETSVNLDVLPLLSASTIRAFNDFLWPLVHACLGEFTLFVSLSPRLFFDECLDGMIVHRQASVVTEPGELFRIDFNRFDRPAIPHVMDFFSSLVIPPFFEGIGDISCRQQEKSLVVLRSNARDGDDWHDPTFPRFRVGCGP
jgi:hypothetical protein